MFKIKFLQLRKTFFTVFQCACITHCISEYVVTVAVCDGPSMEPTLTTKDIVISEHISTRLHRFNYGDIVIAKSPQKPKDLVCKRITGLPGDKISYKYNQTVPLGHVWLEGDNRDNSSDSRDYGAVPQGLIRGRIICKIWPLSEISMLTVKSK